MANELTPEEHLADLLQALPPAPSGWVAAATELPLARSQLDSIVARSATDAEFRRALFEDLESALRAAGIEPDRIPVDELRRRLAS